MVAIDELQKLILWCRRNRVSWSTLTFGSVTIHGTDMKVDLEFPAMESQLKTAPAASIYERYGGDLMSKVKSESVESAIVEEDEE